MAKVLGNARKCYIGSGTGVWIAGEQSNQFDMNGNLVETSDKESTWQTFIQGIRGATATVTCHVDTSSAQQLSLLTAITTGDDVDVVIAEYSFKAKVASCSETNDNGSVATRTFNLTANGAVTIAAASNNASTPATT
jgi:hypothetical protein